MLAVWIGAAFLLGLVARQFRLPPLVGFLAAGFALNALGVERTEVLDELAHLGVLLLLFTVGLKLRLKNMLRAEVWGGALLQFAAFLGLAAALQADAPFVLLLAIAGTLAFSSTVLAAKILDEKREIRAFHGRVAIGILIVQDIIAVGILAATGGTAPGPSAALVLLVPAAIPLLHRVIDRVGHGELLVLLGAVLALGVGAYGFESVGLSAELGALVVGMSLAGHRRAIELGEALWGTREFFLVGFFLTVGLAGLPTVETLLLAAIPLALLPLKVALFFALLLMFALSARTAFLTAIGLASYSEFGLIVMAGAARQGLVPNDWLVATAIAVAASFVAAAPLNRYSHDLFKRLEAWLRPLERRRRHPDDEPLSFGSAEAIVVGMGRVGTGAYDYLRESGQKVIGLDSDFAKVERHLKAGRRVLYADAEDPGLWPRVSLDRVKVIVLAIPDTEAKVLASRQLRRAGFRGLISATYTFAEDREPIVAAGADITYNYFNEAGVGLAADTLAALAPAPVPRTRVRSHRDPIA
jgi:predicted Kef-type K+ transport protein